MPLPQVSVRDMDPALQDALRNLGIEIVDGTAVPAGGAAALQARLAERAAARAARAAARGAGWVDRAAASYQKGGVL